MSLDNVFVHANRSLVVTALGIDPGLRSTGIAAVQRDGELYTTRGVKISRTEPNPDHARRDGDDDARRLRAHWVAIRNAIELLKPDVIGVENYLVFEPKGVMELRVAASNMMAFLGNDPTQISRVLADDQLLVRFAGLLNHVRDALRIPAQAGLGQAAKTIAVFGVAVGAAYTAGVPVLVFVPGELKQRFGGRRGASKEEVGAGLERLVGGLPEQMAEKVPQKTLKEHAWDATGHAILAADEYVRFKLETTLPLYST